MHFSTLAASSALLGLTAAKNIDIIVGKTGLTFSPNSTTADEGDTLTFKFWPKAHSVVQGSFASPCEPLSSGGFFSDFVPVSSGAANRTFVVTVNNTDPIWYYCSQGEHCQAGMVGVINPPASSTGKTLDAYASSAADASNNTSPDTGVTGGVFESSDSSSSSSTASGSSSTASSTPASASGSSGAAGLEQGVGFGAVLALVAGVWAL